jgi:hypothetical protein
MRDLPAAEMLLRVSDTDLETLREMGKKRMSLLALLFVSVPLLRSFLSLELGNIVLQAVLPTVLYSFIIADYSLLRCSLVLLLGF